MDKSTRELLQWIGIFILIILVVVGLQYTDWDYVCTSWWRYTKTYMTTCTLKGYPLFP